MLNGFVTDKPDTERESTNDSKPKALLLGFAEILEGYLESGNVIAFVFKVTHLPIILIDK